MASAAVHSVTTADAGSVGIALPAGAGAPVGGISVNSSLAGSVNSTGASNVPSIGWGAVDASSAAAGGCVVTTIAAGAVDICGPVRNVNTRHAGSVKIDFTAARPAVPATGAAGDSTHGPGAGTGGAGGSGQEDAKVCWKVAAAAAAAAAAALDLFDLAHGDKLRAFVVVVAGAAEMHARGAIGRRILYASFAMLLVGVAVRHSAWILSN